MSNDDCATNVAQCDLRVNGRQVRLNAPVDRAPSLDACERFLALVFLRRYVTYCARRRWFAQMHGAGILARSLTP